MNTQTEKITETDCAEILSSMFRDADVQPNWPASSAEVAEVLRSGGAFDVSQVLVESWARSASVGRVAIRSGKFSWTPSNMLAAVGLANGSRLWLLDSKHIPKMTGAELAELQARSIGETIFTDLNDVDIQTLIGVIAGSGDKDLRSTLCLGLVAKLRHDGVIL
jgi:hypothetical protein